MCPVRPCGQNSTTLGCAGQATHSISTRQVYFQEPPATSHTRGWFSPRLQEEKSQNSPGILWLSTPSACQQEGPGVFLTSHCGHLGPWASHCLQWPLSTATVCHSSALQKAGFGSCPFSAAWGKKLITDWYVLQLPTRKPTNVTSGHSKPKEVIEFWGRVIYVRKIT